MTEYRRFQHPGASWFFTVNLAERRNNRLLTERIDLLRAAFAQVKYKYQFQIDAIVILPEHLHCILTLPEDDTDFSTRWGLIKAYFSHHIAKGERISQSRASRGKRGLWQRRFWDHLIHVKDWPHSSFHRYVNQGGISRQLGNGRW